MMVPLFAKPPAQRLKRGRRTYRPVIDSAEIFKRLMQGSFESGLKILTHKKPGSPFVLRDPFHPILRERIPTLLFNLAMHQSVLWMD